MRFKKFLQEKREVIGNIEYYVEPTPREVLGLTKRWKRPDRRTVTRWIYSIEQDEFAIWRAGAAIHFQGGESLYGVDEAEFDQKFIVGTTYVSEDILTFGIDYHPELNRRLLNHIIDRYASAFPLVKSGSQVLRTNS